MNMTDHIPTIQLLNHAQGYELNSEILTHLKGCETCAHRLQSLEEHLTQILTLRNPEARVEGILDTLAEDSRSQPSFWLSLPALGTLAALALLLIILLPRSLYSPLEPATTYNELRRKGGLTLIHFVEREGLVLTPDSGFAYRPGDKIYLDLLSPEKGFISVYYEEDHSLHLVTQLQNVPVNGEEILKIKGKLVLGCQDSQELIVVFFHRNKTSQHDQLMMEHQTITLECERR